MGLTPNAADALRMFHGSQPQEQITPDIYKHQKPEEEKYNFKPRRIIKGNKVAVDRGDLTFDYMWDSDLENILDTNKKRQLFRVKFTAYIKNDMPHYVLKKNEKEFKNGSRFGVIAASELELNVITGYALIKG